MCGIWGFAGLPGSAVPSREQAHACVAALSHRGPDGSGLEFGTTWALGHTRLAILDPTTAAAQPMRSRDGRFGLVFNGEIFNFPELRCTLTAAGHSFASSGDTEVLLAAYRQWGTSALDRLAGMFAFAVHDARDGSLLLVRDRFGIKPLYYLERESQLAFSSEPKGLLPLLPAGAHPDLEGISAFLTLRHVPAPRTLFRELRQVVPGGWLRWNDGRITTGTWWQLSRRRTRPHLPSSRVARTRGEVVRAVGLWSRSDTPVAAFVSGGLDSSVLVTELVRGGTSAALYTAEYDVPGYSEAEAARETATAVGGSLTVVGVPAGVAPAELARLVRFRDHPLGMHNEVALARLAEAVRDGGAKVVLCGEGADELLAGYGRLSRLPFELLKPWRRVPARGGWRRRVDDRTLRHLLEEYPYLPFDTKHRLLRPDVLAALDGDGALLTTLETFWHAPGRVRRHRRLMRFLLTVHLPGLLAVLDGDAMASGVEARVPFLDHLLVDWLYRLPQRARLRWRGPLSAVRALCERPNQYSERRDVTKWILRKAFANTLPPGVLARRKQPFPAPLNEWFASAKAQELTDLVLADDARLHEFMQPAELRRWWSTRGDDHPDFGRQAWMLANLEVWLRLYFPAPKPHHDDPHATRTMAPQRPASTVHQGGVP
jgi:asparagine synthase (glutamine-hydrolysing)